MSQSPARDESFPTIHPSGVQDDFSVEVASRYVVLRSFNTTLDDQILLTQETVGCHVRRNGNNDYEFPGKLSSSLKLSLGISCGDDLSDILPRAIAVARKAFQCAAEYFPDKSELLHMSQQSTPLTGLALLYGVHTSMPPHYDSPTQPGRRHEWLVMLTLGNPVIFRCNDTRILLQSGDVLVMDSMGVLHGIDDVLELTEPGKHNLHEKLGLPYPSRLGILFWQGRQKTDTNSTNNHLFDEDDGFDGFFGLFDHDTQ